MKNTEPDAGDFFRYARSLGMTAAEMVPPERRAAARAAGLELINASGPGMTQGLNRKENHATLLPQIVEALKDAAQNSIPWVIVFSGNREGQADKEGIENCVAGIRQLLPECERTKVGLLFEMLNSYDHADYQAASSRYGFEVVERVGSPYVKALYDIYHMERMGEDYRADLSNHMALIGHIHCAAAPDRSGISNSKTADYHALAKLAVEKGYTGWFGQEFIPHASVRPELAAACKCLQ